MKRCIIVGAGELSISEIPVREEDYVIAADGGYVYCRALGIVPDLILGDFDSIGEQEAKELARIQQADPERVVILPVEKDDTDMLAAIRAGLSEGCKEFYIYGGQGGRFDHTIANIQCLKYLKECGAAGYMLDGSGTICVIKDEAVSFAPETSGYFSLFSLGDRAEGVTIRNMKYELEDAEITNSYPIGISNEFIGKQAFVAVQRGTLVIIVNRTPG